MARLNDFIARFERHMTGRDWVATGHFTQADITAAVALDFARVLRIDAYADHPAVAAWRARLAERPHVQPVRPGRSRPLSRAQSSAMP